MLLGCCKYKNKNKIYDFVYKKILVLSGKIKNNGRMFYEAVIFQQNEIS